MYVKKKHSEEKARKDGNLIIVVKILCNIWHKLLDHGVTYYLIIMAQLIWSNYLCVARLEYCLAYREQYSLLLIISCF